MKLPPQQSLISTFNQFDDNRQGFISKTDMGKALHRILGRSLSLAEMECILGAVDETFYHRVSLMEYLDVLDWLQDHQHYDDDSDPYNYYQQQPQQQQQSLRRTRLKATKEELQRLFESFDVNGKGTLSGYELKAGLARRNIHFSDTEIDSILQHLVGEINFPQFVDFMMNQ